MKLRTREVGFPEPLDGAGWSVLPSLDVEACSMGLENCCQASKQVISLFVRESGDPPADGQAHHRNHQKRHRSSPVMNARLPFTNACANVQHPPSRRGRGPLTRPSPPPDPLRPSAPFRCSRPLSRRELRFRYRWEMSHAPHRALASLALWLVRAMAGLHKSQRFQHSTSLGGECTYGFPGKTLSVQALSSMI